MFAPKGLNELLSRKRLLVAEADRQRQAIVQERQRVRESIDEMRNFAERNRWWLMAAIAGSLLLPRRQRGLLHWLAPAVEAWRALRRQRQTAPEE